VEQTVNNAYQIHKNTLFLPSNQEWLLWISSGHIECCEQFLTNMTVSGIKSAIVISVGFVFSATEMELIQELKLASGEYRFCFEDTSEDHVVISVPGKLRVRSLVLEQLIE
jgi:hypothetical protein